MVRMISTKRPLPHLLQPTGLGENIPSLKLLELGLIDNTVELESSYEIKCRFCIKLSNPE